MAHFLFVNVSHACENLSHKYFNVFHWNVHSSVFSVLNNFFQVLVAKFKYKVLDHFAFIVLGVVDVQQLDYIFAAL